METCKTFKLIPIKEIERVFNESDSAGAEIDSTFLCFEDVYEKVAKHCNKNTTILDFGCSYMAQSYWFTNCKQYIGIDIPFRNNVKFKTDNSTIYLMTGQNFIKKILPELKLNEENTIAVCSYVPDEELQQLVANTFKYNYVQYCDHIISNKLPGK